MASSSPAHNLHTPLLSPSASSLERSGRPIELSNSPRMSRSPSPSSSMRFRSATINVSPVDTPATTRESIWGNVACDESGTMFTPRPDEEGMVPYRRDSTRTKYEDAALYVREGEDNEKFASHPNGRFSKKAYNIVHNRVFYTLDLFATVMLLLLALVEDPPVVNIPEKWKTVVVTSHSLVELMLLCFIGSNILLRLIWYKPKTFLRNRIMLAALVWVVMYTEALVVLINRRNHFRVTRCLRPIFFIDTYLMFGVRRVLRQIFQCLKPIIDVMILLFFMIAVFSLMGYYLFATINAKFFDSYLKAFVSLFITLTTANHPDVFMEAYYQNRAAPLFFILYLFVTLYFFSNVLLAVVYAHFNEIEKNKFRKLFLHKREALKLAYDLLSTDNTGVSFQDFMLFMAAYKPRIPEYVVMCIFKAMMKGRSVASISTTKLKIDEFYHLYDMQHLNWIQTTKEGRAISWYHDFSDDYSCLRIIKRVFRVLDIIVHMKMFNPFMAFIVLINSAFLMIYTLLISIHCGRDGADSINPVTNDSGADCYEGRFDAARSAIAVSFFFNSIYLIELFMRLLAVGPVQYFRKGWNRFDFILVVLCFIALCVEVDSEQVEALRYLIVIRPLKLLRLLRLHKRYHRIMNTIFILIHRLSSVLLLMFLVVFYFFAIIGMEVFKGKVFVGCCDRALYNVSSYFNGTVNSSNVYWLNNFDNLLQSYVILYEEMVVNNWFVQMEGFVSQTNIFARIYFFLFWVTTTVVLSVVVAFVVEAFVFQIQTSESKKHCTIHPDADKCHCVKSVKVREEVRITLEDRDKLRYVIHHYDEQLTRTKEEHGRRCWSPDHLIRKLLRIDFDQIEANPVVFTGKGLSTRSDLNAQMFKSELEGWIEERARERELMMERRASPPPRESTRSIIWSKVKSIVNVFIE